MHLSVIHPSFTRRGGNVAATIRVGDVGATVTPSGSGYGTNAHVPALRALPEYELKAVCTAHPETARASAAEGRPVRVREMRSSGS
jgi:predicted dehydrogenase